MKKKSIEHLLKPARMGDLEKIKELLPHYPAKEISQAMRACIVNDHNHCVEHLAPLVAQDLTTDSNNMTYIEQAFVTTITTDKPKSTKVLLKYIDFQKNSSLFLALGCIYKNKEVIEFLIPLSDIEKTWVYLSEEGAEKSCLEPIKNIYEALQEKKTIKGAIKENNNPNPQPKKM